MAAADITRQLVALRGGDRGALDGLLPAVYDSLKAMAHRRLGLRASDRTLDTTSLVHEAFLKLFDQTQVELQDRRHFFAVASIAMRQIVIDNARRHAAAKRGGGAPHLPLDDAAIAVDRDAELLVSLDEALSRLSRVNERSARVVELRWFAGLSVEETAEVLEVDPRTVKRDWRKARALLHEALTGEAPGGVDEPRA